MAGPAALADRSGGARPARASHTAAILVALGFAFSPLLLDLARHFAEVGWTRYALVFPPLLAWQIIRAGPCEPSPRAGWALVSLALLVELIAVGGGVPRFGRPALVLALLGAGRALGLAPVPTLLLAAWAIPIPSGLLGRLGSPLTDALGQAAALIGGLSAQPDPSGVRLQAAEGESLLLRPSQAGVTLVALLSGLGWLAGLRGEAGLAGCALRAAALGLAAPLLQLFVVLAAGTVLAAGRPEAAALLWVATPWVLGTTLGLGLVARSRRDPA